MLKRLWDLDFTQLHLPNFTLVWVFIAAFVTYQGLNVALLVDYFELFGRFFDLHTDYSAYRSVMYIIAFLLFAYVLVFVLVNEQRAKAQIGRDRLYSIAIPHFLVNVIDLALVAAFLWLVQQGLELATGRELRLLALTDVSGPSHPLQGLIDLYDTYFPTYVQLPYLLAIAVTLLLADLPIFILHYAAHWSRFLWLVTHRSHHSPEFLHPFGAGPVFAFGFLMLVPLFLVRLAISKLVYPEPLLLELVVIQVVFFITEKFNHSSVFYGVAFRNRWVYGLFSLFGNGPYHMTHHSAREGEEIVNLANVGFNFWDRLFGTFQKPDRECPPLGLTNQPRIRLNPFRLYLSGLLTILYELRHNAMRHWWSILFGSVYYTPPVTRDFLIESYPEARLHSTRSTGR